ncbi:MAG: alpha/beta fold hydrolase [Pseudomonadota bacterium]|nr:alpha/beta fold hydrolase [Pseudomonadota bacterium]
MDDRRKWIEGGTHFQVGGEGPPLVLIHGVGLDLTLWAHFATAFESDFTVIRYDMLGHGLSAKPPGRRRLDDFVAQLHRLHEYLDVGPAAVAGFSMGGLIARSYVARHPDKVGRLVLMNTVFERNPAQRAAIQDRLDLVVREGTASTIDMAMTRWFSPGFLADHTEIEASLRHRLESNDAHGFLEAYRLYTDADGALSGDLESVACPTLVVTGSDDVGSTPAMAEAMAARVVDGRCLVFLGHRHMGLVEDPDPVIAALRDFL